MKKIIAILLALSMLAAMGLSALAETADGEVDDAQLEAIEDGEDDMIEDEDDDMDDEAYAEDDDADDEAYDEDSGEAYSEQIETSGSSTAADGNEEPEAAGLWYGEAFGMILELNLRADGAYTLSLPVKGENRSGRWETDGDLVILDRDKVSRVILHAEDDALFANIDGVDLTLTRDESEPFDGVTLKEDVVMADFTGQWVCALVGVDDVFVDAAGGDESPLRLEIKGENVVIDGGDGSAPTTAVATYANSVMTIDLGADTSCLIRPLDNDMLSVEVNLGPDMGVMNYYFERYEPEEEQADDADDAEADAAEEEEDDVEPEGDAADSEDAEADRIRAVIESRVTDRIGTAGVDDIIVDFDGESYAADISLTWPEESSAAEARTTLSKYSDDLAAYVGQRCRNVDVVDIHWTLPELDGAAASLYYMRGDDGMADAGSDWDSAFDG